MLDQLARVMAETNCPVDELSKWSQREELRVPKTVTSYSPTRESPLTVDVTRTIEGFH